MTEHIVFFWEKRIKDLRILGQKIHYALGKETEHIVLWKKERDIKLLK